MAHKGLLYAKPIMEHGEAFEWADTICQAHNANTSKNPIKFLTLWKEKQKRKTEESKGKKKMASNRSINLNRNQKIVSSLCKHLSLDPVSTTPFGLHLFHCFAYVFNVQILFTIKLAFFFTGLFSFLV